MTPTNQLDIAPALALVDAYDRAAAQPDVVDALRVAAGQAGVPEIRAAQLLALGAPLKAARDGGLDELAQLVLGISLEEVRADRATAYRLTAATPTALDEMLPEVCASGETTPAAIRAMLAYLVKQPEPIIKPITYHPAIDIDQLGADLAASLDAAQTPMLYSANGARIEIGRERLTRFNVDGTVVPEAPYDSWDKLVAGVHYLLSQGWTRQPLDPETLDRPQDTEGFEDLLERSSLGTPGTRQLRERTSPEEAAAVVRYAHELDDADLGETMAFGDDATGLADG